MVKISDDFKARMQQLYYRNRRYSELEQALASGDESRVLMLLLSFSEEAQITNKRILSTRAENFGKLQEDARYAQKCKELYEEFKEKYIMV